MKKTLLVLAVLFTLAGPVRADRGPVIWHEDVRLVQESQKAIILHNGSEEILVLGTELKANKETDILEFIPFPSEPKAELAKGNPFEEVSRLISEKGLVFQVISATRSGGQSATVPVEIRLSEKIGLHDVTVIKINDIGQFSGWLENYFKGRGIEADREKLSGVYSNALDYINRGYKYFVFDHVRVTEKTRFIEPLIYRFKTDRVYYPLKTSNLIGGRGAVEMVLILPGSLSDDIWQDIMKVFPVGDNIAINLSSSSKLTAKEIDAVCPSGPFFGKTRKIYLQVLQYKGPYGFKDDLSYNMGKLVPYAHKHKVQDRFGMANEFVPPFTGDELRDLRERFCPESDPKYIYDIIDYRLDCGNFIPEDEYEVYAALFKKEGLSGIPSGRVVLDNKTVRKELKGRKINKIMLDDFNKKNKASYPLENAFPAGDKLVIELRGDGEAGNVFQKGSTGISRAGFNRDRTRALVYVEHITSPRSGVGYFVRLEKKSGEWEIEGAELGIIY